MGVPLATAFVRVRADTSGFEKETERDVSRAGDRSGTAFGDSFSRSLSGKAAGLFSSFRRTAEDSTSGAGAGAGRKFGEEFVRDAAGRLRDGRGRFITEGAGAGSGFGEGFVRDASGRLRDARGRFVGEGRSSGEGFSRGFSRGLIPSMSGMQMLIGAGISLGPALIPVAAAAAAAVAGIGTAAVSALAGVGVIALAFNGIGDALSAMGAAEDAAADNAASLSRAHSAVAAAADGVRNAEQSLARAREQAADGNAQAARQVTEAERDLVRAQQDAREIALELNEARQQAKQRLDDLNQSVKENSLSQRQANLDVAEAKAALDKVLADPKATLAQQEQARITYEREVLQLEDLQRRGKQMTAEQAAATKAGVEGSREVEAVRKRIADADERVRQAQQQVTDARKAQQRQERDGARQIQQAQQQLIAAQRSYRQATVAAGTAGAAAMDKLKQAMAGLSPAGQKFAKFLFGLKDEFRRVRDAAQAGLLPGVQKAIENLLPYLPQVERFVGRIGATLGVLAVKASEALTGPVWKSFFGFIDKTAGPALTAMFDAAMNVATGFASILQAFGPLNADMGAGLVDLTAKFAAWAGKLSASKGFQDFLDYVRTNGPLVLQLVGNLAEAGGKLVSGLAPLGAGSLGGLVMLTGEMAKLSPETLAKIATGIAAISAAVTIYNVGAKVAAAATVLWSAATKVASAAQKVWTGIQWAFNAAAAANPIGIVIVAVVALIAAIVIAYKKSDTFRAIVQKAWAGIQSAVSYAWENVIKPALSALVGFFTDTIAPAAMWLWNSVIKPAFNGIGAAISFVWTSVIQPVLAGWKYWFTEVVGPALLWLWRQVVLPAWRGIQLAISVAWAAIQIIFGLVQIAVKSLSIGFMFFWKNVILPVWDGIKSATALWWSGMKYTFGLVLGFVRNTLGPIFTWLRDNVIKPVWEGIKATISAVWEKGIKPVFTTLGGFLKDHVAPAFKTGVSAIEKAWEKVKDVAKVPVKFIVDTVINSAIIDTYNKIAEKFGVDKVDHVALPKGFARGGVLPGYTPGRDVHRFYSPTGGALDLSGGEAILRPEGTRALGRGWVDGVNAAARAGGVSGVQRFLGGFADGGILGTLGKLATKARKTAGDVISEVTDFVTDPAGTLRRVVDKVIDLVPGKDTTFGRFATAMPRKAVKAVIDKVSGFFQSGEDGGNGVVGNSPLGGSAGMMRILRQQFPGLRLISGYRPGSVTLSGNRSYHSTNRAVDVPPIHDVAEWIYTNMRKVTRELITPWPEYNLLNGKKHRYTGAVWNQHNFAGGNAHDHWAARLGGVVPRMPARLFDGGGDWPSGTVGVNLSGRTEHVSTGASMDRVATLLEGVRDDLAALGEAVGRVPGGVGRAINGASSHALHMGRTL
ncbi:hypothetical protein AB0B63_06945 [Micromonospora sp. NPDC049081]|uniref:phage tail protein n=1 Tax=Micromonospora sp. NPDC049081 TaxID=3155150 RepID=UPI0033D1BC15